MKARAKREGPLKITMDFDEAIKHALMVKPPPGGWNSLERGSATHKRKRTRKVVMK